MMIKCLNKSMDTLSRVTQLISGILLLVTCFNVTYGVIMRYVFNSPSIHAIELTKLLLIPALVFAVVFIQWNDRHLRVDFIFSRFPRMLQHIIMEILVPIMGLFVVYILVWKGWSAAVYSFQIHEISMAVWSEPLYPIKFTIPIGYALLFLVIIGQLFKGILGCFSAGKSNRQPETTEENITVNSR
jgi:C4-dicarboxylate transporter, DctQ subunit